MPRALWRGLALVAAILLLTIQAEPAMRYLDDTAEALTQSAVYIGKVMTTAPVGADQP